MAALTTILVGIDITLAGLFWALDGEANVMARLIKKILYVGTFAFILNNFSSLATIIFNSFSTLGLAGDRQRADGADLLQPGQARRHRLSGGLAAAAAGGLAHRLHQRSSTIS